MKVHVEFDERRILAAVQRGSINALRRAGAYVRQAARNRVAQSAAASAPGSPPNTRRGLLKRSLLFGVEKQRRSVIVGPAEKFIGTAMKAHEFGGIYRKRRYPKRPLMGPALQATAAALLDEVIDFFPEAKRKVFRKILGASRRFEAKSKEALTALLDDPAFDAGIDQALEQLTVSSAAVPELPE